MYPNAIQPGIIPNQKQLPPTSSAVNIQIIEPKNYSAPEAAYAQQMYNYPTQNYFDYPQAAPLQYPYPPQFMYPQNQQVAQYPQPVQPQLPMAPIELPPAPVAVPAPLISAVPVAPAPTQAPVVPVVPTPVIPTAQEPVVPVVPTPVTPAAQAPVAPAVPVAPAPTATPVIDINSINAALRSANLDEQTLAIQKVAEIAQSDKQVSQALLNEDSFKALAEVVVKDTKTLAGPDAKQLELRQKEQSGAKLTPEEQAQITLSPQEKADLNKQYGMYTLALLQKNFREAVDQEAKNQGVQPLTINELPGIVQIVENVKSDPNPAIREAGIQALKYIAKPEDKEVLKTIYDIAAKQDEDPAVKLAAETALKELPA